MLFVLTIDHIKNVFLCFLKLNGHGKLDLKFVHGRVENWVGSNKICPKRCIDLRLKLLRKIVEPGVLEKIGLFSCGHIYFGRPEREGKDCHLLPG